MPFDQAHNPHLPQRILIDIILERSSYGSIKSEKKQFYTILFIILAYMKIEWT